MSTSTQKVKVPNFNDAIALYKRARSYHRTFINLISKDSHLWKISEHIDIISCDWVYEIEFDESKLIEAKLVLADCANNYRACLDHIISELARQKSDGRHFTYFPKGELDSKTFTKSINEIRPKIGERFTETIEKGCRKYSDLYICAEAILFISNSVKHWKLVNPKIDSCILSTFDNTTKCGIIHTNPIIIQSSDLSYELYRDLQRLENYDISVDFSMQLHDIPTNLPKSVKMILSGVENFILKIFESVQITHESILDET